MAMIQTEQQMLKPRYACAVAENTLTRPRTKKAWSPKIGGNNLELARWSSHLPVQMERARFCVLEPKLCNVYLLVSCAGGDSIPYILKVLCDGSRMRTTIHYVVIKPDSRPDGTAIRDCTRARIYFLQRKKMRHKL